MHRRIKITGMLLLSVYALLLLHNFIPHSHSYDQGHKAVLQEHGARHHHHNSDKPASHDHIPHSGHFDHSVFDLLLCFIHEMEHPANHDEHKECFFPQTRTSLVNFVSATKNITLLTSSFSFNFTIGQKVDFYIKESPDYQPPPLLSHPARGPPLVS